MNDLQTIAPSGALVPNAVRMSAAEVTQHAIAVQEVMKAVMKRDVHYGVIPFTDKPTLYKAGAEVLCMTFRIADEYRVDDLSTSDTIRYRVVCVGRHQITGAELGSGMGEGSTSEEKYRWRKAVCQEEFYATPETMRRAKFSKGRGGSFYVVQQVRTEPADLANTVLKMACKRAKMAMVLNVTAASDCFTQDIEDLTDELREHLADTAADDSGGAPANHRGPQRKSAAAATPAHNESQHEPAPAPAPAHAPMNATNAGCISGGQAAYLRNKLKAAGLAEQSIADRFQVADIGLLTVEQFDEIKSELLQLA